MSFENNNISLSSNHTASNHKTIDLNQWADKNFQIPQSQMNKLIMDYLVTGTVPNPFYVVYVFYLI